MAIINLALDYLKETGNAIPYTESMFKKNKEEKDNLKTIAVYKYRRTREFEILLNVSIIYLKARGYITLVKYGLTPYIDSFNEVELQVMGLVPV